MDKTLTSFIATLRNADVRISPAETLDALNAVELTGYRDREFLKNTLALVLPKTADEKDTYDTTFEQFFKFAEVAGQHTTVVATDDSGEEEGDGEGQGQGDGQGGSAGQTKSSNTKRKGRPRFNEVTNEEKEPEEDLGTGETSNPVSALGKLLMQDSRVELSVRMADAAKEINLETIQVFTQKGLYTRRIMDAMGLADLLKEMSSLKQSFHLPDRRLAQELKKRQEFLREQVRDYVEQQFLLYADATGMRLREELLRKVKLSNVEHRNFRLIQEIVYRMAKKLVSMHSQRKKVFKRGTLNVPRTLRHNMSYDGHIFDLHWKSVKVDRPKVFAICDVSGSVANYARFMLMFLYALEDVMPKVRSFAFSSDLAEVTELFERNKIEDAIAKTLRDYGGGSTDYGQALVDFKKKCLDDVDNRTTIIILGDARNNYGDCKQDILQEIYSRSKRVIWLNPESRNTWNTGDAEMRKYTPYVHQAEECNSLVHLERTVSNLLKSIQ
ncbi:MAG: VWA domain-containing protein [Gammaproteobacteria bacterium]|nr:VWA domain-containing protein [Gammaproteobacteria bacterium]